MNDLYDFLLNFTTTWVPAIALSLLGAAGLVLLTKKYIEYKFEIDLLNNAITLLAARLTGWSLLCVSAAMNMQFGFAMSKGFPAVEEYAVFVAVMMGAINLCAGWSIALMKKAHDQKRTVIGSWAALSYFLIVMFSLMTASSVLFSGHEGIETRISNTDTQIRINEEQRRVNAAQIAMLSNTPSSDAYQLGSGTMRNANGRNVSVSKYCRQGNWYANNSTACQQYLTAQANSGAAAATQDLRQQNVTLLQASLDAEKAKPAPMTPLLFGFTLPPEAAYFFVALIIEIAAGVCLLHSMTGTPSQTVSFGGSELQTQADLRRSDAQSKGGKSGSKGGKSARSGNADHLPVTPKTPPLKEQKRAYEDSIGSVQPEGAIPTELLEDLLYQLAIYNPGAQINVDHVIELIRENRGGVSVGKERLLKLISSDRMADIVLTGKENGRTVYTFNRVEGASDVQQPSGAQGLPASQSALSQSGAADHGRRAG